MILDDNTTTSFAVRIILDAIQEADRAYWQRRAALLEAAKPRRDDYTGSATPAQLAARTAGLDEAVTACRNRARMAGAA